MKPTNKISWFANLGTSIIYSPMSPPSPVLTLIFLEFMPIFRHFWNLQAVQFLSNMLMLHSPPDLHLCLPDKAKMQIYYKKNLCSYNKSDKICVLFYKLTGAGGVDPSPNIKLFSNLRWSYYFSDDGFYNGGCTLPQNS